MPSFFTKHLLLWHQQNPRPFPWSDGTRNPYYIWLSEIIMQQTRIEQGTAYYLKFIKKYPTVNALASASTDDVMYLWEGLGYYTRARNLHKAAQYIVNELHGVFPDTYDALLVLPGIGPYSAAAISSFAFGARHAVVDGNVKRVLARYEGIEESIDDPKTHREIHRIAMKYMKGAEPDVFNQAIMNFGALVCKPVPLCHICPLRKKCYAYRHNMVLELPVRTTKKEVRRRFFSFVVLEHKDHLLMHRRHENDIWKGLYAFPLLEKNSTRAPSQKELNSFVSSLTGNNAAHLVEKDHLLLEQLLSHQLIRGRFYNYEVKKPSTPPDGYAWIPINKLNTYGKPRMIVEYLKSQLR